MKKKVLIVSLVCGLAVVSLLGSCLKNDSNVTPPNNAFLSLLQASPDAPPLDIYLNGEQYVTGLPYPTPLQPDQIQAGLYRFRFQIPAGDSLVITPDSLAVGHWYTLISYDSVASLKGMLIDNRVGSDISAGQAAVRFLQLSPDETDPVDVYLDSVKLFSGRTFADNVSDVSRGQFNGVDAGTHSLTAVSALSGDTLGRIGADSLQLQSAYYTFYLRGFASRTDSLRLKLGGVAEQP